MKQLILHIVLLTGAVAALGCAKELPRGAAPDQLYEIGLDRFEKKRWGEAIEALQRFVFQAPGHEKVDSAEFLMGEAYFNKKEYLTASIEFLRLAQNRPAGPLADDARYRACESYVQLSPRVELDQEYTLDAIDQCRSVVLLYPQSPFAAEATARVKELTDKLARKHYLNAVYYAKRRAYDSAIVYLEYLLSNYRGAVVEPEALLTLYDIYNKVGYTEEAEQTRQRLVREYPDSPEAQSIQENQTNEAS